MDVRQRKTAFLSFKTVETHSDILTTPHVKNKSLYRKTCWLYGSVIWIAIFTFGYVFSPLNVVDFKIENVALEGVLFPNTKLSQGIRVNNLIGPECIVEDEHGTLYSGLANGRIVTIYPYHNGSFENAKIKTLADGNIKQLSPTTTNFPTARPSGLRLHGNTLYVADCVYGLYSLNTFDHTLTALVDINDVTPPLKFPNDLDITKDGKLIYFSDVDERYSFDKLVYGFLSGQCYGRLLEFRVFQKKLRVVASGLCGANGVQLSDDETHVIVTEMYSQKVTWIDVINGQQTRSIFMPMLPDGVTKSTNNSYLVAGSLVPRRLAQIMFHIPVFWKALAGLLPHDVLAMAVFLSMFDIQHNIVIEINNVGEVIQSLHDPDGNLTYGLAHATHLHDGRLALGSFIAPYIAIVEQK